MDRREFFRFSYDRYKDELSAAELAYHRTSLAFGALVVICSAFYGFTTTESLWSMLGDWKVRPWLALTVFFVLATSISISYLMGVLIDRKYPTIGRTKKWQDWRNSDAAALKDWDGEREETLENTFYEVITNSTNDTHSELVDINERRMRRATNSLICAALAGICLMLMALINLLSSV